MAEDEKPPTGRAIVNITVEVALDDVWGADCTVGQIQKDAGRQATEKLRKLLEGYQRTFRITAEKLVKVVVSSG